MRDYTLSMYLRFLDTFLESGYEFQLYRDFIRRPAEKVVILRHDVDARKVNALKFARIQHERGICGTYYFRMIPKSFDEELVREIASLGHEIGYHYEDMDFAGGDPARAIRLFEKHLNRLREQTPVQTICMHGSPLSRHDNREIWNHYDYRDYGIIAEPYFDLDFSRVLYLTDTGRRWDGDKVSIRDRVSEGTINKHMEGGIPSKSEEYYFRSTLDILKACREETLPDQIMFTFHPQRWTDHPLLWTGELVLQNIKNVIKAGLNRWGRYPGNGV